MNSLAYALAVFAVVALCAYACSPSRSPPDVQFLATDLHFMVDSQHVVIPAVAMGMPGHTFDLNRRKPEKTLKERLTSEASDPRRPMTTDHLDLSIRQYRYYGDHSESTKICALLTRKWSRSMCVGAHDGMLRRLPERFELLATSKLDLLQYHFTVGLERRYDQVKGMALQPGITEISCDRQSKFCTAVVNVLPGVLAVWTVWSDEKTGATAQMMADTQGPAIVQFVRHALAPVEDATFVDAE